MDDSLPAGKRRKTSIPDASTYTPSLSEEDNTAQVQHSESTPKAMTGHEDIASVNKSLDNTPASPSRQAPSGQVELPDVDGSSENRPSIKNPADEQPIVPSSPSHQQVATGQENIPSVNGSSDNTSLPPHQATSGQIDLPNNNGPPEVTSAVEKAISNEPTAPSLPSHEQAATGQENIASTNGTSENTSSLSLHQASGQVDLPNVNGPTVITAAGEKATSEEPAVLSSHQEAATASNTSTVEKSADKEPIVLSSNQATSGQESQPSVNGSADNTYTVEKSSAKEPTVPPSSSHQATSEQGVQSNTSAVEKATTTESTVSPFSSHQTREPNIFHGDPASTATAQPSNSEASPTKSPLAGQAASSNPGENAVHDTPATSTNGHVVVRMLPSKLRSLVKRLGEGSDTRRASSQPAPGSTFNTPSRARFSHNIEVPTPEKDRSRTTLPSPTLRAWFPRSLQLPTDRHEVDTMDLDAPMEGKDNSSTKTDTGLRQEDSEFNMTADGPGLPQLFITPSHTAVIRTSSRARKPTIRALEGQQPRRVTRQAKSTAEGAESPSSGEGRVLAVSTDEKPSIMTGGLPVNMDEVSKRVHDSAMEIFLPKFQQPLDGDAALRGLQNDYKAPKAAPSSWIFEGKGISKRKGTPEKFTISSRGYPQTGQQWTDDNGWMHTGHTNDKGEEIIFVPGEFAWYRPAISYGDEHLPEPPVRVKSQDQVEKDRIFGFPPPAGRRNEPFKTGTPFAKEDVEMERNKVKARDEARRRNIAVTPHMSLNQIRNLIKHQARKFGVPPGRASTLDIEGGSEKTRKRRREALSEGQNTTKGDDGNETQAKKQRQSNNKNNVNANQKVNVSNKPKTR